MRAAEVEVHHVQGNRRRMILDLLRESVGKASEPATPHADIEILSLYVARIDKFVVEIANDGFLLNPGETAGPYRFSHLGSLPYSLTS